MVPAVILVAIPAVVRAVIPVPVQVAVDSAVAIRGVVARHGSGRWREVARASRLRQPTAGRRWFHEFIR